MVSARRVSTLVYKKGPSVGLPPQRPDPKIKSWRQTVCVRERGDVSDYFSSPFAEREGSVTLLNGGNSRFKAAFIHLINIY